MTPSKVGPGDGGQGTLPNKSTYGQSGFLDNVPPALTKNCLVRAGRTLTVRDIERKEAETRCSSETTSNYLLGCLSADSTGPL